MVTSTLKQIFDSTTITGNLNISQLRQTHDNTKKSMATLDQTHSRQSSIICSKQENTTQKFNI